MVSADSRESDTIDYMYYENVGNDLLKEYDPDFEKFVGIQIADKIIYYYQRKIGEAIVEGDQIIYHFDRFSQELTDVKIQWREDLPENLPEIIPRELAESLLEGKILFSRLYYISPTSVVFPLPKAPNNPCWVIRHQKEGCIKVTIIDAVEARILGPGVPPPYTAFSLTGPTDVSGCSGQWQSWYIGARNWFNTMGYDTEAIQWPTQEQVKSHVQSFTTAMFYELAHGGSTGFSNACNDSTTAGEIETWITDYPKMPFAFIGSCGGLCSTGNNTFSYEFRKGSNENTVTVGYCGMGDSECSTCWGQSISWQNALFSYMNQGWTVKAAFDQANIEHPTCASNACMRFAGDEIFALVPVVSRSLQARWYVDSQAPGANNGTTWTDAFIHLQNALAAAFPEDEIWVAQGDYRPDQGTGMIAGDRKESFTLINGVAVYGGFPTGGGDCQDRDPNVHETILSGDLDDNDGPDSANNDENSYHVVIMEDTATLDGFTVKGGFADGDYNEDPGDQAGKGAGILCKGTGNPVISTCKIIDNATAGELNWGGGLYCSHQSRPILTNCRFINNSARWGGGMYGGALSFRGCFFQSNQAGSNGGGINGLMGSEIFSHCAFIDNSTAGDGGGIFLCDMDVGPTFINCTFVGNRAEDEGGALYLDEANATLRNCILWQNTPDQIITTNNSHPLVDYCNIQGGWDGQGNITTDPLFANVDNGDLHLLSAAGRWDPNDQIWVMDDVTCRCIDAGSPGSPLADDYSDGNNVRINMGTFGGTREAGKTPPGWGLLCDLNNDGVVEGWDYSRLADHWLKNEIFLHEDVNRDGTINSRDLKLLLADWLSETTWH